jgi:hypothetical protein
MPHSRFATSLQTLTGQVVFHVADTPYFWEDVLLAAQVSGDWAELVAEVRQGIACLRHQRATRAVLREQEVEAAARAFREARQLYTAAETEAWLADRSVTVGNWLKYIRRSVLRLRWADQLTDLVARYPAAEARIRRALKIVGICSGHLARFARQLAGRAAIHERLQSEADNQLSTAEPPQVAPLEVVDPMHSTLLGLAPERLRERSAVLGQLAYAFERFRRQVLTPEAIRRQITARHTDWICLECVTVSFADATAAREAALCVRQDGEDLQDVAARARTAPRPDHFRLEELPPDLRAAFLSARKGELLGPLCVGPEFRLFLVRDKTLPSEKDPVTRQRAEQILLQSLVEGEIARRITWHYRPD